MAKNKYSHYILGGLAVLGSFYLINKKMKISKYFYKKEVTHSNTALREGIDNVPTAEQMANAERLAKKVLDPVRKELGKPLFVSSWFRSEELNNKIGGSRTSHHLEANAVDLTTYGSESDIWRAVLNSGVPFTELIIEYGESILNPKWVHLAYNGYNSRNIKRAFKNNEGRTQYTTIDERTLLNLV
jgi:zinc D-Ala-D-Ala carboxypeptidase